MGRGGARGQPPSFASCLPCARENRLFRQWCYDHLVLQPCITGSAGEERGSSRRPGGLPLHRLLPLGVMAPLKVVVVSASGLRDKETFGRMDPYCVLECEGWKVKTKVAQGTDTAM